MICCLCSYIPPVCVVRVVAGCQLTSCPHTRAHTHTRARVMHAFPSLNYLFVPLAWLQTGTVRFCPVLNCNNTQPGACVQANRRWHCKACNWPWVPAANNRHCVGNDLLETVVITCSCSCALLMPLAFNIMLASVNKLHGPLCLIVNGCHRLAWSPSKKLCMWQMNCAL